MQVQDCARYPGASDVPPHPTRLPEHGGQTWERAPSGPAPRLLLAGPARREGGHVCFVQGSPGPMWLCRKLPEILRKYSPLLQGGGRRGMRPAQPFCTGRCLPPLPLALLCRPQLSPTCLATQRLRPGGRPHPSTSALNNQRSKGHPRVSSWAAHPRTLAPGGKVIRVEIAFRQRLAIYAASPGGCCLT